MVQATQSFPYFLEWALALVRSPVWGVRDRNIAWRGSPYAYPMSLAGAGATPQPISHGGDGAAAAGSGAAQEADSCNPRTLPLGEPKKHGTRVMRECGLGARGLDSLLGDALEPLDLEVTRAFLNLDDPPALGPSSTPTSEAHAPTSPTLPLPSPDICFLPAGCQDSLCRHYSGRGETSCALWQGLRGGMGLGAP